MGSLGVSSFQQVYGALLADAVGPNFQYWDEWQMASGLLRPGLQHSADDAGAMLEEAERRTLPALAVKPKFQDELHLSPWNMTDERAAEWIRGLRQAVCHEERREKLDLNVVRIQGNFQHVAYFRRYRAFIHHCILRSPQDFVSTFYRPEVSGVLAPPKQKRHKQQRRKGARSRRRKREGNDEDNDEEEEGAEEEDDGDEDQDIPRPAPLGGGLDERGLPPFPADVVVYLRLGDKALAGDTLLTFQSGYYDAVLSRVRPQHDSCWIVTNSIRDDRATSLASKHACSLQTSGDYYSDWAALYLAPKVLVMAASTFIWWQALVGACEEVHFPAVGFFHDKHNVCMRQRKQDSHFGQMRLAFGLPADDADHHRHHLHGLPGSGGGGGASGVAWDPLAPKRVWYHDVYSEQWFLTFDELAAEVKGLPCESILHQHVCEDTPKPQNYRESRYCYFRDGKLGAGNESVVNAKTAARRAHRMGGEALAKWRAATRTRGTPA